MTYKEVFQLVSSIPLGDGFVPAAYYMFPEDDPANPAPPPPFIVYFYPGSEDLAADNTNYQIIRPLTIELYTDTKDFALEAEVESALTGAGLVFSRSEEYIESQHLFMVVYDSTIIITEESQ